MVMKRRQKLKTRAAALSGVHTPTKETLSLSLGGGVRKARSRKEAVRKEKKRDLIERETSRKKSKTKKKAPGLKLDGLQAALMQVVEDDEDDKTGTENGRIKKKGGVNIRSRKHRIREESAQLSSVLANDSFKSDPVAALREHLLNTVCAYPLKVPAKPAESYKDIEANEKTEKKPKPNSMKLEIDKEELDKIKETARESIRAKRERKEAMAQAAQAFQQKRKKSGVDKVRISPHRGRIGVKRPKLLDDINMDT